jgi:hypothetical protein
MVFMFRTKEGETEGNNGFMESFTLGRGTSTSSININWTSFSLEIRHFIAYRHTEGKEKNIYDDC